MNKYFIPFIAFVVMAFIVMTVAGMVLMKIIPSPGDQIVAIVLGLLAGAYSFRATLKKGGRESTTTSKTGRTVSAALIGLGGLVGVLFSVISGLLLLFVGQEKPVQKMEEVFFLALLFVVSAYLCFLALGGSQAGQSQYKLSPSGRKAMSVFLRVCGLLGTALSLFLEYVTWMVATGKPADKIGDGCLWGLVLVISAAYLFVGIRNEPQKS